MTGLVKKDTPVPQRGEVASTILTLFRDEESYTGPWRAPAYSVFSNANRTALFLSREDAAVPSWNPVNERYETFVVAESIATGSAYNLPAGTITQIVSEDLIGFIGVVNDEPSIGGADAPPSSNE